MCDIFVAFIIDEANYLHLHIQFCSFGMKVINVFVISEFLCYSLWVSVWHGSQY